VTSKFLIQQSSHPNTTEAPLYPLQDFKALYKYCIIIIIIIKSPTKRHRYL